MKIQIKTPAKINLNLKVGEKREDGFHPIESVMQSISLFDTLTITLNRDEKITLSGNNPNIPYNEKNLVYKAIQAYFEELGEMMFGVDVYIEKNIPTEAGLGGGSANAAGLLYGLNLLMNEPFTKEELLKIASKIGSDVNFCFVGGTKLCKGRGEILEDAEFVKRKVHLVKPKNFGVSTKVAYEMFDNLKEKSNIDNDLEFAIMKEFEEIEYLHNLGLQMSGSGSCFFTFDEIPNAVRCEKYDIWENLETINFGVFEI